MIRYGIAGFGLHAEHRLMKGFAEASNSRCVALSRRNLEKAAECAARYGVEQFFASTEELCRCPEVDAVFVATPNAVHLDDVLTAARCGKPVLLEKPMGLSAEEARRMTLAMREAGLPFGVAQCFRFCRSVERLRERLRAGEIGRPLFARCSFHFSGQGSKRQWLTDAALSGGGPIADVGVHCIDALRAILGRDPVRVAAFARDDEFSGEVESAASLLIDFAGGSLASVEVSYRAVYGTHIEISGENGVLRSTHGLCVDRPVSVELLREGRVVESESVDNGDVYSRQVDAFSAAVAGASSFAVDGESGLVNQMALDAAYRSLRSGRAERVE